jgi:hypothetical protein
MTPMECQSHSAFNLNCCPSPVCLPSIYYTHNKPCDLRGILPKPVKNLAKSTLFVLHAKYMCVILDTH